jgi:hypothetical protein
MDRFSHAKLLLQPERMHCKQLELQHQQQYGVVHAATDVWRSAHPGARGRVALQLK